MNLISTVIKDCTTLKNGNDYDVGRILWIIGVLVFFGMSIFALWKHGTFDPMNWGAGFGGILAGGGAGLKFKSSTEPE